MYINSADMDCRMLLLRIYCARFALLSRKIDSAPSVCCCNSGCLLLLHGAWVQRNAGSFFRARRSCLPIRSGLCCDFINMFNFCRRRQDFYLWLLDPYRINLLSYMELGKIRHVTASYLLLPP